MVFSGCHSGPRAFLGFSLNLLRPFLGTRGGKGFRVLLLFCFSFPLLFCGHTFSRMTGGGLTNPAVVSPAPRPSEGQGVRLCAGLWTPLFVGFCRHFLSARGSQGPSDAQRPGTFLLGRGPFLCLLRSLFHTARFLFPPLFFCFFFFFSFSSFFFFSFSLFSAFGANACNSVRCSENTPAISEKCIRGKCFVW